MRIVENSPERLAMEDKPVALSTLLAILIVICLCGAFWTFSAAPLVAVGAVLAAAVLGICLAAFTRRVFVVFDRAAGAVVIRSASLFGETEIQVVLNDIAEAVVETTTSIDDHGSTTARALLSRAALRLKDGRPNLPLTEVYSSGKGAARVVDTINRWIVLFNAADTAPAA